MLLRDHRVILQVIVCNKRAFTFTYKRKTISLSNSIRSSIQSYNRDETILNTNQLSISRATVNRKKPDFFRLYANEAVVQDIFR